MIGCMVTATTERTAITATNSRVEIVQSLLRGGGGSQAQCSAGGDGAPGLVATNSRVQAALSNVFGGRGGDNFATCSSFCGLPGAGHGGPGLVTFGAATQVFVTGKAGNLVKGGFAGISSECSCDGDPATARS